MVDINDLANEYASDAAEADGPKADNVMVRLGKLAEKQADAEQVLLKAQEAVEIAKKAVDQIAERELPQAMEELGMEMFQTSSGLVIKIKESIRASIPKNSKGRALQWLREHGHAALIKRCVSIEFGRDDDDAAKALADELLNRGLIVEDEANVHTQTLAAFVREALAEGKEIPMDLLGVFRQRKSVIEIGK